MSIYDDGNDDDDAQRYFYKNMNRGRIKQMHKENRKYKLYTQEPCQ